eukprot:2604427-Pyramimonas_sp.AAC.1
MPTPGHRQDDELFDAVGPVGSPQRSPEPPSATKLTARVDGPGRDGASSGAAGLQEHGHLIVARPPCRIPTPPLSW